MKLLLIAFIVISAVFASPKIDPWNNIDWDKVVPVQDLPGFWDNRDPALRPKSPSHGSRVVGGSVAIPHQFPYQAAVLVALPTGTGLCGGSVISNTVVLSAGHCVSGVLSAQVILGANDRSKNEANQLRNTIYPPNLKLHEDYNATGLQNDVGLIFLPYFNFTIYIQPVLLDSGNDLYNEEFATVSGFGRYSDSSSVTSNVVRYVSLKVITNYVCELTFGPLQDYQMCTSGANKKSSCSGDSGGPLAIKVDDYSLQIGIVSFGAPTCQTLYPAGFSRVNFFKDWIDVNSVADQF